MSAPTTAQAALAAILAGEDDVQRMRMEYDRRRVLVVNGLNEIGLKCFEPQGAFYAFPSVEISGMNDDGFANALLEEEHVACVPGNAFGETSGRLRPHVLRHRLRKDRASVGKDAKIRATAWVIVMRKT